MYKEAKVDPYFSDALRSRDPQRMESAIREYLGMYLNPSTLSNLVVVSGEFFAKDKRDDHSRYTPTYVDNNQKVPNVGTIILNIDTVGPDLIETETVIYHDILLFCMTMEYVMAHPDDKRLKKPASSWVDSGLHGLIGCFNRKVFYRNYGSSKLMMVYVAPDLSALYTNHGFYTAKVIKYLPNDRIVIHNHQIGHHVSFAVGYHYTEQEYDTLAPAQIEAKIKKWKIDNIIRMYDLGHSKWLTNDVFASTFDWTDDGLVYTLNAETSDECFAAFVNRNPDRLLQLISGKKIKITGEWVKDQFKSAARLTSMALGKNNRRFDKIFLEKPSFSAVNLTTLAAWKRYDLLLAIPVDKIGTEEEPSDFREFGDFNHQIRENFFGILGEVEIEEPKNMAVLEKIIEKYWPVFKGTIPKSTKADEEETVERAVKNLLGNSLEYSPPNLAVYNIIKKIDPDAVKRIKI